MEEAEGGAKDLNLVDDTMTVAPYSSSIYPCVFVEDFRKPGIGMPKELQ